MNKYLSTAVLSILMFLTFVSQAANVTFNCTYANGTGVNGEPLGNWTTTYPEGDTQSATNAALACFETGGTASSAKPDRTHSG